MRQAAFVYDDALARHQLRSDHPMRPVRLQYTHELLQAYGAFDLAASAMTPPREATEEELQWLHGAEYIAAVRSFSLGLAGYDPRRYNFSADGDNPTYPGMYDAAALSTGASLAAAELVADGKVDAAFSISGGLHHAAPDHASGFCVFNDPALAIHYLLRRGLRVAYVDIDAHHGDGVQHAFYEDDRVLTISVHESGQYLFPGTGFVQELGAGRGAGYSVNLPLYPVHRRRGLPGGLSCGGPAVAAGVRSRRAGDPTGDRQLSHRPADPLANDDAGVCRGGDGVLPEWGFPGWPWEAGATT